MELSKCMGDSVSTEKINVSMQVSKVLENMHYRLQTQVGLVYRVW